MFDQFRKNDILRPLYGLKQKSLKHKSCKTFQDLFRMVRLIKNDQVASSETSKQSAA